MKKINQFIILFLIFIITLSLNMSYAHSVELDPEGLITFPMIVTNGKGTIGVSGSISDYTLYYQAVEIPDSDFKKIEDIQGADLKNKQDSIKEEIDKLSAELNSLKDIFEKAKEAYDQGVADNLEETEIERLLNEYTKARDNYMDKYEEYKEKIEEANNITKEAIEKVKKLTPEYIESNWKETTDKTFNIDLSQFSGKKAFVIWVKLVTSDGATYYDEAIYSMNGTKKVEEDKKPEIQEPSSDNKGQSGVDGTLVKSSSLPKAGVTYTVLFAIIIFAVLGFVIYRKDKDLKLK